MWGLRFSDQVRGFGGKGFGVASLEFRGEGSSLWKGSRDQRLVSDWPSPWSLTTSG